MTRPPRFSFLSLERWHLAGRPAETRPDGVEDPEAMAHLEGLDIGEVPPWLQELETPPARSWVRWMPLLLAAMALFFLLPESVDPGYVGVKGTPSVAVHVQRGERTATLDAFGALLAGDVIRLQVAPAGTGAVTVLSGGEVLHSGPVDGSGTTLLPGAWELDDEPTQLLVVFTAEPPETPKHARAVPGAVVETIELTGGAR